MGAIGKIDPKDLRAVFDCQLTRIGVMAGWVEDILGLESSPVDGYELSAADGKIVPRGEHSTLSWIDIGDPQLNLLLGRNGAGKSQLLKSLDSLTPIINVFSLPTAEHLAKWKSIADETTSTGWFKEMMEQNPDLGYDLLHLPILHRMLEHLDSVIGKDTFATRQTAKASDVLAAHGISSTAIESWAKEPPYLVHDFMIFNGNVDPIDLMILPDSYDPRLYVAQWYLDALRNSRVLDGEPLDPWTSTNDSKDWLSRPTDLKLVGSAFEQLIESCSLIVESPSRGIQFVTDHPDSGPLRELFELRAIEAETLKTSERDRVVFGFPYDLFTTIDLGFGPQVATAPFRLADTTKAKSFLTVESIDFSQDTAGAIREIWRSQYLARALKIEHKRFSDPGVAVSTESEPSSNGVTRGVRPTADREEFRISGLSELESSLATFQDVFGDLGLGIEGLRVRRKHGDLGPDGSISGGNPFWADLIDSILDEYPIECRAAGSGHWITIENLSSGQRDVLLLLLSLARSRSSGSTHFIVVDEFDQHLHPTATAALLPILQRFARRNRVHLVLSTHNIPVLEDDSVRQAPRIFAERDLNGTPFYHRGETASPEALQDILGVDVLARTRLAKLFVLVEGLHDEIVIRHLLESGGSANGVEIVNALGTWSFQSTWHNVLRHHSAPVVVVYDKVARGFEELWQKLRVSPYKKKGGGNQALKRFEASGFGRLDSAIRSRRQPHLREPGDDELRRLLDLVRVLLRGPEAEVLANLERVTFLGLDCRDIVDLLPIEAFPEAASQGESWSDLWKREPRTSGETFKNKYGIREAAVRTALSSNLDVVHPELQRLFDTILRCGGSSA